MGRKENGGEVRPCQFDHVSSVAILLVRTTYHVNGLVEGETEEVRKKTNFTLIAVGE